MRILNTNTSVVSSCWIALIQCIYSDLYGVFLNLNGIFPNKQPNLDSSMHRNPHILIHDRGREIHSTSTANCFWWQYVVSNLPRLESANPPLKRPPHSCWDQRLGSRRWWRYWPDTFDRITVGMFFFVWDSVGPYF